MSWVKHIPKVLFYNLNIDTTDYWHNRFSEFFKKNSILRFEQLNIWHNDILNKLFLQITGRKPKLSYLSRLNLFLYFLLEYFRFIKKFLFNRLGNI